MSTNLARSTYSEIIDSLNKIESDTILLVVDHQVWPIIKEELSLEESLKNKKLISWKAPSGEQVKNFAEFESCLEFFLEKGVHRNAHLVAIGGGATSDFAGYVAASLLRGIKWSIIPTTLLSMVDASIGGKVAINSKFGKNLVGAFHNPENVWICTDFLSSLPEKEVLSGKGEILKYCFLSKKIFDLVSQDEISLEKIIKACADYKLKLTEEDFKESGKRKILNLGHTIGHAIERIYSIPHGEAVMWGMVLIFKVFQEGHFLEQLEELKKKLDWFDKEPPWKNRQFPLDKIMEYLSKDKKMIDNTSVDLILIEKLGKPIIEKTKLKDIEAKLERAQDELRSFSL